MDSAEYCLWLAEYQMNPWDERRSDLRAGVIASSIANYAGKCLKENTTAKPLDFMPYDQPEPEEISSSPDDLDQFLESIYNGG